MRIYAEAGGLPLDNVASVVVLEGGQLEIHSARPFDTSGYDAEPADHDGEKLFQSWCHTSSDDRDVSNVPIFTWYDYAQHENATFADEQVVHGHDAQRHDHGQVEYD